MRVLIVGASGLVGGNCLSAFRQNGWDVVGTYFSYQAQDTVFLDTLNPDNPDNFDVQGFQPDVIVHCGALTWVDHCEEFPEKSYKYTVSSAKQVIDWCKQTNARMVYFSTDYVFDGKSGPYTEDDAVNPLSVYGSHKLEAEQTVLQEVPGSLVLRITNVFGTEERGKNFIARMVKSIQAGEPLAFPVPVDQYATPVNAADLAKALILLLQDGKSGIYNLAGTDFLNRYELAMRVLRFFPENQVDLNPVLTETMNQKADRPLVGGLITAKFSREYPDFVFSNVDDFLLQLLNE